MNEPEIYCLGEDAYVEDLMGHIIEAQTRLDIGDMLGFDATIRVIVNTRNHMRTEAERRG